MLLVHDGERQVVEGLLHERMGSPPPDRRRRPRCRRGCARSFPVTAEVSNAYVTPAVVPPVPRSTRATSLVRSPRRLTAVIDFGSPRRPRRAEPGRSVRADRRGPRWAPWPPGGPTGSPRGTRGRRRGSCPTPRRLGRIGRPAAIASPTSSIARTCAFVGSNGVVASKRSVSSPSARCATPVRSDSRRCFRKATPSSSVNKLVELQPLDRARGLVASSGKCENVRAPSAPISSAG